ncbi:fatty acyl-CoA reductase wat-like [Diorhabda sublineata]|uniref:fatty acyl-CoA reductase wat-like n=1 Tax=Diorhabda sublineata TaxID=1163346 RepID=UPI0024E1035A|nr:fatty acyl-CoA reductase wat-like [Diorhabda sublineata]XP_056634654.1 fatty acyl-CoA reductase wat-like [Diorhabda sublineata]XP_056634655.1 fatty acyl-CoA reductase wat-like [Diorhabda sublineata]XP_056634656.1 fatty acyl-CoA reductase wat-like [Diorhabda sublineata]XP_056634657.1 fatty acyl-CoA reductase wat-like [Diorhabda sublineata]XP_056634658.1 fatty acyl-CoA reductase wat-like [Diorhabda sublineata]XP_056634659.1 fatty acyl-CoA reductase wat-like [Diorhabda sublineata]
MDETPIQSFYKNANVLITGGTGFMGKILIEKLLRSTDVGTLYLLVRDKRGKNVQDRLNILFEDKIFNRLKEERPKFEHRVKTISGDLGIPNLGISKTDEEFLKLNINIVFHMAATIKFNENLKSALEVNVRATQNILDLAKQMRDLKSIVYVSTAYSNCPQKIIREMIYESPASYEELKSTLDKLSYSEIERITPRLIGKWPNTYSFTKCMAESLIKKVAGELPIAIFRPSIVVSTYREPLTGWKNNYYGPTGVFTTILLGLMRVYYGNPEIILDIVPADMCISGLIATAWDISDGKNEVQIYNYVSGAENPVSLKEIIIMNVFNMQKNPTIHSMWKPFVVLTQNYYNYWFLAFIFHLIPAVVMDFFCICMGKKPRMFSTYRKIHKANEALYVFSSRSWEFSNNNMRNVWQKMQQKDKHLFNFNIADVNWMSFCGTYIKGIRKYILKDPDSTLVAARKRARWFNLLNFISKYLLIFMAYNTVMRMIT